VQQPAAALAQCFIFSPTDFTNLFHLSHPKMSPSWASCVFVCQLEGEGDFATVLRIWIRIQLDPYIIGSPGSGSSSFKTDKKLIKSEIF